MKKTIYEHMIIKIIHNKMISETAIFELHNVTNNIIIIVYELSKINFYN